MCNPETNLEKMQGNLIKFEKLIFFTGLDQEGPELEELLDEHDDDTLEALFGHKRPCVESLEDEGMGGYFFANVHTPIRKHHEKGSTGFGFSWGYCTFTLLFAPNFDELVDKAVAWAKGKHEGMKNDVK